MRGSLDGSCAIWFIYSQAVYPELYLRKTIDGTRMTKEFYSIEDVKQYLDTVMEGFLIRMEVLEAFLGFWLRLAIKKPPYW